MLWPLASLFFKQFFFLNTTSYFHYSIAIASTCILLHHIVLFVLHSLLENYIHLHFGVPNLSSQNTWQYLKKNKLSSPWCTIHGTISKNLSVASIKIVQYILLLNDIVASYQFLYFANKKLKAWTTFDKC